MNLFNEIKSNVKKNIDDYKTSYDPKWLIEVSDKDHFFKDFEGWLDVYEQKPKPKEVPKEPKKQSQAMLKMEQYAVKKVMEPIALQIQKGGVQMMLQSVSVALTAAEKYLIEEKEKNLAKMLNALNGVILSLRFQKHLKYDEIPNDKTIFSKQFNENSRKMRFFRKTAIERFYHCFDYERAIIEKKIITKMIKLGELAESTEKVTIAIGEEKLKRFRALIQIEIENRIKTQIMDRIKEKKADAIRDIESSKFFELKDVIAQKVGVNEEQQKMIECFIQSGMDQMIDLLFKMVTASVETVFARIEQELNFIITIINGFEYAQQFGHIAKETGIRIEQHLEDINDDQKADEIQGQIQTLIEKNYLNLVNSVNNFVQSLVTMLQVMANASPPPPELEEQKQEK